MDLCVWFAVHQKPATLCISHTSVKFLLIWKPPKKNNTLYTGEQQFEWLCFSSETRKKQYIF